MGVTRRYDRDANSGGRVFCPALCRAQKPRGDLTAPVVSVTRMQQPRCAGYDSHSVVAAVCHGCGFAYVGVAAGYELVEPGRFELPTSCVQSRCSPT